MTRFMAWPLLALIAVTTPAYAQMGGGKRGHQNAQKSDTAKPKVDEKAYKAALDRIPDPKEKYDPWGIARAPDPGHKKK